MRKILKWLASGLGVVVLLVLAVGAWAWVKSDRAMARTYASNDPPLIYPTDPASLAKGQHLFATRGCADCHGENGAGNLVFDAGPVIRLVAPNITRGGRLATMSADQVAAAIRNGVHADGRPLVFMPSPEYNDLGDTDTAALVAYVQSLPSSSNDPGQLQVKPVGRILYALGRFPLLPAEHIDHRPRSRTTPASGNTVEFGHYLTRGCTGCHGANLGGQHVPGTPPSFKDAANLTPGGALSHWKEADFRRALRQGKRPDGSALDAFMPWRAIGKMSDQEIAAIWLYLQSTPPVQARKPH